MFFGRGCELTWLDEFLKDDKSLFACIYGRYGIGKTCLVRNFLKDKPHIYYNSYATTGSLQMEIFARVVGYDKGISDTFTPAEQLRILLEYILSLKEEGVYTVVIDQFVNFIKSDSGFEETLVSFMEEHTDIKFIFCSDTFLQIQKILNDKKSLLKEKSTYVMELTGLGYYDSMEFLRDITDPIERAFIYGITGGIPSYLERSSADRRTSIKNIFFERDVMDLPAERMISSELRELSYYNHILLSLAKGFNRVNQISAHVGKPKDVVVPYMNTLMSIGLVAKENPVTEKTNRKKTRYSIVNNYDLFWYKFFCPYIEKVYEDDVDYILENSIAAGEEDFMKSVFVSMCREYLIRESLANALPFNIAEIGNWWQNDDENQTTEGFDLVAVGDVEGDETIMFARCYYTDEPVGIATLKELIDLTKRVRGKKNVFYLVFSKNGFHENTTTVAATIKNIILVTLEEIMNG